MEKKQFERTLMFANNYKVDTENGIITNFQNKSVGYIDRIGIKRVTFRHDNQRLTCCFAEVIAIKAGLITEENYHTARIKFKDNDTKNCKIKNITIEGSKIKSKSKYSMAEKQKIWNLSLRYTPKKISEKLGIEVKAVYRIIKEKPRLITELDKANFVDENLDEKDKETILFLYKAKTSLKAISEFYKIPKKIIKQICIGELW